MRAVIDTNVLLSGLIWRGAPHTIIEYVRSGEVVLITSPTLIEELAGVIGRAKFRKLLAQSKIDPTLLLSELQALAEVVDPSPLLTRVSRDPDDDAVLALAAATQPDFIVSGDTDLLVLQAYAGIPILNPAQMLTVIAETQI